MEGPTLSQRVEELKRNLNEVAGDLAAYKAVAELGKKVADDKLVEVDALAKKLQEKVADAAVKLAAVEERVSGLDRGHDRLWQIAPMVVSVLAILVSVIVAFVKKWLSAHPPLQPLR